MKSFFKIRISALSSHARYCQEQEMPHFLFLKQQTLSFTYRSLRNTTSLYTLYFYILRELFPAKELDLKLLKIRFKASLSLCLKKYSPRKVAGFHLFGRVPFPSFKRLKLLLLFLYFGQVHKYFSIFFPSALIPSERAVLKTRDSLYNNGVSRYRNMALFHFKLKFVKMD